MRNAVEVAHKAAAGWGKRAAHNRAQIVYYMAENLELRRSEIAQRLADVTGRELKERFHLFLRKIGFYKTILINS